MNVRFQESIFAPSGDVSVIIPVRDRWESLLECLDSLDAQKLPPAEVIVIDDGSTVPMPAALRDRRSPVALRVLSTPPRGIAAARNRGIAQARHPLVLFTDSDCILAPSCLAELVACAERWPDAPAFQLAFSAQDTRLVWCIDALGKVSKQQVLQTISGHIRYLDTAGVAIRSAFPGMPSPLFDVTDVRGEDTTVLARLVATGMLPRFVPSAQVAHRPAVGLARYLVNHFRIGYHTSPARARLRAACRVLMSNAERSSVLLSAWRLARSHQHGIAAFFLLLVGFAFESAGRLGYRLAGIRTGETTVFGVPIHCLPSSLGLEQLIVTSAERHHSLCVTYLHAWSLVQARIKPEFAGLLRRFDVRYSDGMGVVVAALALNLRRLRKVTANDFILPLCREAAERGLHLALIGGPPGTAESTARTLRDRVPGLQITFVSAGYLSPQEEQGVGELLKLRRPNLILLGMGQPRQEQLALKWRAAGAEGVFLCVGGLFDYLLGKTSTPPRFVRRIGFEWLWRLIGSPRYLWRRYLIGLPALFVLILREHVERCLGSRTEDAADLPR